MRSALSSNSRSSAAVEQMKADESSFNKFIITSEQIKTSGDDTDILKFETATAKLLRTQIIAHYSMLSKA